MARAALALDALGDSTRREIAERLARRPSSVQQLADALPVSRPAVSQHLRILKEAQVVTMEPHGTRRIYRLDPRGAAAVRHYLDRMWDLALDGFDDFVASEASAHSTRVEAPPTSADSEGIGPDDSNPTNADRTTP